MAEMTLSNHVFVGAVQDDTFPEWVSIERIVWVGATNAAHLLEINDTGGKSVLEPIRAGSATVDREIPMYGKRAKGLNIVDLDSGVIDIYLRQI